MGTRGPKRQTRATLPVVLHWRHRSLRSPVHSVHKKVRRQLHEFPTASGYSTLEQQEGLNDSTSMQSKITCQWKAKTGKDKHVSGALQIRVHKISRVVRTVDTSNGKLAINLIPKVNGTHGQVDGACQVCEHEISRVTRTVDTSKEKLSLTLNLARDLVRS